MTIEQLAIYAGFFTVIFGAGALIVRPIINSFTKLNNSIAETNKTVHNLSKDIDESRRDRGNITKRIDIQSVRLDRHHTRLTKLEGKIGIDNSDVD